MQTRDCVVHVGYVTLMLRRRLTYAVLVLLIGASACSPAPRPAPPPPASGGQIVVASWYGANLDGRRTASGERFDADGFTAAHRSLPLGTRARVTNLANGRSVVVRINDRGPFVRGRVIDLSYGAARALGMQGCGTGHVHLEVLGGTPDGVRSTMQRRSRHRRSRSLRRGAASSASAARVVVE